MSGTLLQDFFAVNGMATPNTIPQGVEEVDVTVSYAISSFAPFSVQVEVTFTTESPEITIETQLPPPFDVPGNGEVRRPQQIKVKRKADAPARPSIDITVWQQGCVGDPAGPLAAG